MIVVAVVAVLLVVVPRAIGIHRGVNVGRTAIRSHRDSVRVGVRVGRYQVVAVVVAVAALIGGAR